MVTRTLILKRRVARGSKYTFCKKMETTADKIGRFCWVSYLTLILPACLFCVWGIALVIREFWIQDNRVIETAPVSDLRTALIIAASIALPVFWVCGVTIGHRFNKRWMSSIPFIAHLLSVTFFTAEFWPTHGVEDKKELLPIFAYFSLATFLLLVGFVAAMSSNQNQKREPQK